jgi:hypothetical protein
VQGDVKDGGVGKEWVAAAIPVYGFGEQFVVWAGCFVDGDTGS